jgi:RNA-directed DNA polymerase
MAERKAPRNKCELDPESEAWRNLPWRKLEQYVYRIQKRIYRASQRGNQRAVQKLQKLLMRIRSGTTVGSASSDPGQPGKKDRGRGRGEGP